MTINECISKARGECRIDSCPRKVFRFGFCYQHMQRFARSKAREMKRKYSDADREAQALARAIEERS